MLESDDRREEAESARGEDVDSMIEIEEVVRVDSLAAGGDGVARLQDGRVVFVAGALAGDRVKLARATDHGRFLRARIGELVVPSAERVEPRCKHFESCGGCVWQHLRYEAQLAAKKRIVMDAIERIGGLASNAFESFEIVPSPSSYGYRGRARWVESNEGIGYRVKQSREMVPIEECPVLVPAAERALRDRLTERRVVAEEAELDPKRARRAARRREREWVVTASGSGPSDLAIVEGSRRRGGHGRAGNLDVEVLGDRLRVSGQSFLQGNALLFDALALAVRDAVIEAGANGSRPERFVELYAGIGFFTIPIARAGLEGVALESEGTSVVHLEYNLRRARLLDKVAVVKGRAEARGDLGDRIATADRLLVDPPRSGLDKGVRKAIAEHGPERVVYVSCDPATLARDLQSLAAAGYRLESLRAFDLFPHTPHVESLATLFRGQSRDANPTLFRGQSRDANPT